MRIIDIIAEDKEWDRNPDGSVKKYDDKGNYIKGSYFAAAGQPQFDFSDDDATTTTGSSGKLANPTSDTPKGATEDQMKRFGPSSMASIDWREMREYIASKLSLNHAVAMVVNCKWESGFKPGRWVHSDASQGPSGGLFMFHDAGFTGNGFFSSMVAACGGPGKWQTNWKGQIDFALSSGIGQGPKFAAQKFRNPEEATHWFCYNFERPRDRDSQATKRAQEAHLYSK